MPKGVAHNFVQLLRGDGRAARNRVVALSILTVLLAAPAWFVAPRVGLVAHMAAVLVGLILGVIIGHRTFEVRYASSLRRSWNRWMRFAVACESIPEVHRKVTARSSRNLPFLYAGILTLFWAAEVGLVALAFGETATLALALPIIALNGLLAAFLLGYALRAGRWYESFRASLDEMIQDGEVQVWGVV